ncbi:MAG: tetratricopeptide repeat protein [Bacteroidia bacterium]|nr:tetratricopeptide repeat protein [Bacteroidia bacterium]
MKKHFLIFLLLIGFCNFSYCQFLNKKFYLFDSLVRKNMTDEDMQLLDSVLTLYHAANSDTLKMEQLDFLAEELRNENSLLYNQLMLSMAEEGGNNRAWLKYKAAAYNNIGFNANQKSEPVAALAAFKKSLDVYTLIGDKDGIAVTLSNMGTIYEALGNIGMAIEDYAKALKIQEQNGNQKSVAILLNNIGLLYKNRGEYKLALEYYNNSLALRKKTGDKKGEANLLNNIGALVHKNGNRRLAIDYYTQSLKLRRDLGDKYGVAQSLNNLADLFQEDGDFKKAEEYFFESLKLRTDVKDKRGMANSCSNLGALYLIQNNISKAFRYSQQSLIYSKEVGFPDQIEISSKRLYDIYKRKKQFKEAMEMLELSVKMKDSLNNEQTRKAGIKQQLKYEYEKRSAADSVKNAELQKVKDAQLSAQTASLKQERFQRYSLVVGLLIVLGGLGFVINRFRITRKQKKIIEQQKIRVDEAFEKLHEKNKEVLDSIYYAKRIQQALLTSERYIERNLKLLASKKKS